MKTYCIDYLSKTHSKIDITQDISCCLFALIEKYNETKNNSSKNDFSNFLVYSLNYYLKEKNYKITDLSDLFLNKEQISLSIFSKFIDILIHYSAIFINLKKVEYAKFILSLGVDLINKSEFKSEKQIIKKKVNLGNNIACAYLLNNNIIKAELFLERCKEKNKNALNKLIIYNNICIITIKKLKKCDDYENQKKNIVDNILLYLNLIFNDINQRIENKYKLYLDNNEYKDEDKNNKNELFCFIIYNCHKMMKIFIKKEFDKNYTDSFKFIQRLLGNHHYITLNMKRLEESSGGSEFIKILLNENYNDFNHKSINKDISPYIKQDANKEIEEKRRMKNIY